MSAATATKAKTPVKKAKMVHENLAFILKPRMSEKAYAQSVAQNTYVFDVPLDANKASVARAVAAQFEVTVSDVRLSVLKGKPKRGYKRRARPIAVKRSDVKKAYVKLAEGSEIAIFEAAEAEAAKEAKQSEKAAAESKTTAKVVANKAPEKQGRLRQAFGRGSRQVQEKGGGK